MKNCRICGVDKRLDEFYVSPQGAHGRHSYCIPCFNAYGKAREQQIKTDALTAYGGKCYCCPESNPAFLSIDHIAQDGAAHRREVGNNIYRWLRRKNFPPGFRTSCFNCNWASFHNGGICPHQS